MTRSKHLLLTSLASAGLVMLAGGLASAEAATKKCDPGNFWSPAKRACVEAGHQAKPAPTCMGFDVEGSAASRPCER